MKPEFGDFGNLGNLGNFGMDGRGVGIGFKMGYWSEVILEWWFGWWFEDWIEIEID